MEYCKAYIRTSFFVVVILLGSCSKDVLVEEGESSSLLQIENISFTGVSTRSATPLLTGDIGVFRLASLGYVETKNNVQYTNSGGNWNVGLGMDPIYLTRNNANLCVYSPYTSDADAFTDATATLNSQLYTEDADFCYQTGVTAASGTPVSFILGHAYAKLTFTLTRSASYSGDCAVSGISVANNGILISNTLNLATGSYGSGTVGTVTIDPEISGIASGSSATITMLMLPTVATLSGDITLTFTVDGEIITTTVDASTASLTALKAGNDYMLNVTINKPVPTVTTTANCYMIAPGNRIKIPVNVRGNGVGVAGINLSASISPLSVGLLWQTSPGLITLKKMSTDKKVTITTHSASGNAVIAAYSGANHTGDILWSWHIWVTNYDPNVPLNGTTFPTTNSAGSSYVFMDRNLGATTTTVNAATTFGLHYQWGRKDPFPGSRLATTGSEPTLYNASGVGSTSRITKVAVSVSSNLSNAILHPLTFYKGSDWYSTSIHNDALWGGASINSSIHKTMFDPSPAGWHVLLFKESESPWSDFSKLRFWWSSTDHGRTYHGAFYPFAGYRHGYTGGLESVGFFGRYNSGLSAGSGSVLYFNRSVVYNSLNGGFSVGSSIRCVQD